MSDNNIRLSVKGVNKRFGGLQALSDVGLEIKSGEIYGLIGPNGAGKTSALRAILGRIGFYRLVWHRPLADLSLLVIILAAVVATLPHWIAP